MTAANYRGQRERERKKESLGQSLRINSSPFVPAAAAAAAASTFDANECAAAAAVLFFLFAPFLTDSQTASEQASAHTFKFQCVD